MTRVKVTRNYQVTIPEKIRAEMEIREGDYVEVSVLDSERIVLSKVISEEELAGAWDEEMDGVMKEVGDLWRNWELPKKKTFA